MLLATCGNQDAQSAPTCSALTHISASCRAQNDAEQEFSVYWSRHLLTSIRHITGSELLIGSSTVTFNPHFPYFSSQYLPDVHLGAVAEWSHVPALDGSSCWRNYSVRSGVTPPVQLCGRLSIVLVTPALDLAAAVACEALYRTRRTTWGHVWASHHV
jgi:hypothetical protein